MKDSPLLQPPHWSEFAGKKVRFMLGHEEIVRFKSPVSHQARKA